MPWILRPIYVSHQCLRFQLHVKLDHFGRTSICWAAPGSYCCGKNHWLDGTNHANRITLIGKHENLFWCITRKWSTDTKFFTFTFFLREILCRQRTTCQMSARTDRKNRVLLFSFPAYIVFASALSWVGRVLIGSFPYSPTEWDAISSQSSGITCITLLLYLFCLIVLGRSCYRSSRAVVAAGRGASTCKCADLSWNTTFRNLIWVYLHRLHLITL